MSIPKMPKLLPPKQITHPRDGFVLKTIVSIALSVVILAAAFIVPSIFTGDVQAAGSGAALEGKCSIARTSSEAYDVTMPDGQTLEGTLADADDTSDPSVPAKGDYAFSAVVQDDGTYRVTVLAGDEVSDTAVSSAAMASGARSIVCDGWNPICNASFFVEMGDGEEPVEVEGGSKLVGSATGISFMLTRVDDEGKEVSGRERIAVDLDATGKAMDVAVPFGEYSVEQVSGNSIASAHTPNKNIIIDRLSQYFILNVDAK